jgi:hypothetical protein
MDSGLTIVMSPVQLAAAMSGQSISEGETNTNRVFGGLRLLAGALEMVGAGALLLLPDPTLATKAGGVALAAHGADTTSAGFWQLWSGRPQRSLTEEGAARLAGSLGADPATAGRIGTGVDIAVPLAVTFGLGALRIAAVRGGRIVLAEHEAAQGGRIGGHTLLKHVGKTEAELRARLLAQRSVPVASTFTSLEVAERTLYQGIRANAAAIEQWARFAAPGAKQPFFYSVRGGQVGFGVVRATNQLVHLSRVRIVLKMEQYNGKLYYILTAFPDL